jgi:hypothetical protein
MVFCILTLNISERSREDKTFWTELFGPERIKGLFNEGMSWVEVSGNRFPYGKCIMSVMNLRVIDQLYNCQLQRPSMTMSTVNVNIFVHRL